MKTWIVGVLLFVCVYITVCNAQQCSCVNVNCGTCPTRNGNCCNNCCPSTCNCQQTNCNTCPGVNPCCQRCCENRSDRLEIVNETRRNIVIHNHMCCNGSSNPLQTLFPNIVLPNITIFINQTPIVVHNNPVINVEQKCGNVSVVPGGAINTQLITGCGSNFSRNGSHPAAPCCRRHRPPICLPSYKRPYIQCQEPRVSVICGEQCQVPYVPKVQRCAPTWPYGQCRTPCIGHCDYGTYQSGCRGINTWPYVSCSEVGGGGSYGVGYSGGIGYGGGYGAGYGGYSDDYDVY